MANTAKTTKKKTTAAPKRAASKTQSAPSPEIGGRWREVMGVILIAVGVVLLYFIIAGTSGAGLYVNNFLRGIAGALRIVIPALFIWAGILFIFAGLDRGVRPGRVFLMALIPLLIFALVHVFSVDKITVGMTQFNYANFIVHSYAYTGGGAGVLGALLSWPLYWSLSLNVVGSTIVLILLLIADLILMGKISLRSMGEKVQTGYANAREQRIIAMEERRAQLEAEAARRPAADEFSDWDEPVKAPRARAAKRAMPREMVIERITTDDRLPGEPDVPPMADEDELNEDLPLYLTGVDRARKKKSAQAEPVRITEPAPIIPVDLPVTDEPFHLRHPVDEPEENFDEPLEPVYDDTQIEDEIQDEPPFDVDPALEKMLTEEARADYGAAKPVKEAPKVAAPPPLKRPAATPQPAEEEPYNYPPIDLLAASKPSTIRNQGQLDQEKAEQLVETLQSFGISATLIGIAHGPTVTRFELKPAAGVKVSRITSLADDIALSLAAVSVRIEAPIPGKAAVGVEVPNDNVEVVPLRDVLESNEARKHPSRVAAAMGRDNAGRNIVADLAKMPHVLIAGATGSGKSVCINSIICSILYRATPEEVKLIMIDPKVVELSVYNGIPHLLVPVVTDPKKAASALDWAVNEMTLRYKKFAELGVRDMKGYNLHRPEDEPAMPQIVLIIDELADLMMVTPGEVEDAICRLAQLARAAGIHLVIATQRPSVNVITGVIKANIPSRVAFTVASQVDSRTILDVGGAEKLLGRGDMLFAPSGTNKPIRVQGAWISDDEVHDVVEYIKVRHDASYDEDIIEHMNNAEMSDEEKDEAAGEYDDLLPQAIETVIEAGQASISMLQRKLRVGYARAGRLIDEMAVRGIVSPAEGAKPRSVLITREQFHTMFGD